MIEGSCGAPLVGAFMYSSASGRSSAKILLLPTAGDGNGGEVEDLGFCFCCCFRVENSADKPLLGSSSSACVRWDSCSCLVCAALSWLAEAAAV